MAHTQPAPTRCTRKSCEIPPKTWFLMTAASKTQSFTDRSVSLQDPKRLEDKRLENMYIVPPSKIWIPEVFIQNLGSIKKKSRVKYIYFFYSCVLRRWSHFLASHLKSRSEISYSIGFFCKYVFTHYLKDFAQYLPDQLFLVNILHLAEKGARWYILYTSNVCKIPLPLRNISEFQ